ncbi:MAG: hypothetical protein V4590_13420 [Bacteroidota bacterium]
MDTALNLRDIPAITQAELASCAFATTEVYTRMEDVRVRLSALDKAMVMSRNEKVKTLLVVNTAGGFRSITTKVLALNPQGVILEGNIAIPMHAIYSVNVE